MWVSGHGQPFLDFLSCECVITLHHMLSVSSDVRSITVHQPCSASTCDYPLLLSCSRSQPRSVPDRTASGFSHGVSSTSTRWHALVIVSASWARNLRDHALHVARQIRTGGGGLRPRRALAHLPDHLRAAGAALLAWPPAETGRQRAFSGWRCRRSAKKSCGGVAMACAESRQLVRIKGPRAKRTCSHVMPRHMSNELTITQSRIEAFIMCTGSVSFSVLQPAPHSWRWGSAATPCTDRSSWTRRSCEPIILSVFSCG